ncbi:MAG TPA: hypothetical protein VGK73_06820, partial [Polyangiaceae bacterium]
MAPALVERSVTTPLGPAPLPTVYEIAWTCGRVSSPFVTYEQAAEYALEAGGFLPSEQYFVDDDGRVYSIDADEGGRSK